MMPSCFYFYRHGMRGLADVRTCSRQQLPQNGAMAAGLLLAVATHRQIGGVGEGGQQRQIVSGCRGRQLRLVRFAEGRPLGRGLRGLPQLHGFAARGEVGEPDVIPVLAGKLGLWYAAWRATYRADPQPLVGEAGRAETDDGERHELLLLFSHFQRLTVADHLLQAAGGIAEFAALVEGDAVAAHVGSAAASQGARFTGVGHRLLGIGLA